MTTLLNLGDIGRAIGPGVVLPKALIATLGVEPHSHVKAAQYFTDEQVATIYTKLAERLTGLASDANDGMLDVPAKPAPAPKKRDTPPATSDDDEL
jgi:hypothetical protein